MPDPVKDANARWTKYALLLLASIVMGSVALLACVVFMVGLGERKVTAKNEESEPGLIANDALPTKDEQRDGAPPKDEVKRSTLPGIIQPLDEAIFLGTRAKGRRFCFIADASMSVKGVQFSQVKQEILQTLAGLQPSSQFYLIFFNRTDVPMPYPTCLDASEENVAKVKPWIQSVPTVLKTWPTSSFDRAFKLQPKPDVIYFMTDGLIPPKERTVQHIADLNAQEPRVLIHTILFSNANIANAKKGAAAHELRTIAEKNGGTFRQVRPKKG